VIDERCYGKKALLKIQEGFLLDELKIEDWKLKICPS